MIKTIKIGSKNYDMKASAFTMFSYKNETGRDILKDIKAINEIYSKIESLPEEEREMAWLGEFQSIIEIALKMSYVMALEFNPKLGDYKDFLKGIDTLSDDNMGWIQEVLGLAINPLFGRIQSSQNK